MPDPKHPPEPAFGPDEEGETPLDPEAVPKADDPAWVTEEHKPSRPETPPPPD